MKEIIETIVEAGYVITIGKEDGIWSIFLTDDEETLAFEDVKFIIAFGRAFKHAKPNYPRD